MNSHFLEQCTYISCCREESVQLIAGKAVQDCFGSCVGLFWRAFLKSSFEGLFWRALLNGSFEGLFWRTLLSHMQGFLESCLFVVVNNNFFWVMPSCCRERCTVQKSGFVWPHMFTTHPWRCCVGTNLIKRALYMKKNTYMCEKSPLYEKKYIYVWKEPFIILGHIKGSFDEICWWAFWSHMHGFLKWYLLSRCRESERTTDLGHRATVTAQFWLSLPSRQARRTLIHALGVRLSVWVTHTDSHTTLLFEAAVAVEGAQFDRKTPPPPGGFPIYYVPSSRTVSERTPLEKIVQGASRGVLLLTVLDEGT